MTILKSLFVSFLIIFSCAAFSQKAPVKKPAKKTTPVKKTDPAPKVDKGYLITGELKGFADGTVVTLTDQQTGTTEKTGIITKGKFYLKGKLDEPSLKSLVINQELSLNIFLDNSALKIIVDKADPNNISITGSASNDQFAELINLISPYQSYLSGEDYNIAAIAQGSMVIDNFIKKYPASYVTPLAMVRYYQLTSDGVKSEEYYNSLPAEVKTNYISQYLYEQILESKHNPIGSVLPEFSQPDTSGANFNITSLRGKYVLIDFWASWCRPCRMENPNLVAAYNKFSNKNFTVLGVSLDKSKAAWIDAIRMDNLGWNHISDLNGWANTIAVKFGISSIPQNFLLDPQGKIIAKNLRGPALEKRLQAMLQ